MAAVSSQGLGKHAVPFQSGPIRVFQPALSCGSTHCPDNPACPSCTCTWGGRCKAIWQRIFKLSWHKAGALNHLDGTVDSGQFVVNKEPTSMSKRNPLPRPLRAGNRSWVLWESVFHSRHEAWIQSDTGRQRVLYTGVVPPRREDWRVGPRLRKGGEHLVSMHTSAFKV